MAEGPVGGAGWDALWLPATVGPAWGPNPLVARPAASEHRWVGCRQCGSQRVERWGSRAEPGLGSGLRAAPGEGHGCDRRVEGDPVTLSAQPGSLAPDLCPDTPTRGP